MSMTHFRLCKQASASFVCLSALDLKLEAIKECLEVKTQAHALVVDGKTLAVIMAQRRATFAKVSHQCSTVLCCRMSPLQKAQIVAMVKGKRKL